MRDLLRKRFDVPVENAARFFGWRESLYLNVLGFPLEPVGIKRWPPEVLRSKLITV